MHSQVEHFHELYGVDSSGCGNDSRVHKSEKATVKSKSGNVFLYFITTCFLLLSIIPTQVAAIQCAYTTKPEQIHLALRPTGMTVSWVTGGYSRDTDTPNAKVLYGTDPNSLTSSSTTGSSTSYYPEIGYRKFFHNIFLDGLKPSTKYYYRIANSSRCSVESDIRWFTTAPTPGADPNQAIKITVIGDVSLNPIYDIAIAKATFPVLKKYSNDSDFILFVGDLGYGDFFITFNPDYHDYENVLNEFGREMDPIASYVPVEVIPGNHEITCNLVNGSSCPNFLRRCNAYLNRYWMSGDLSGGYSNLWYSFDYGPIHIIMLNMETDFPDAPSGPGTAAADFHAVDTVAQVKWFQSDLQKANDPARRAKFPWLIVNGHRAFGGSDPQPAGPPRPGKRAPLSNSYCVSCRTAFMHFFDEYKVDFYLAGHVHWMELLYPMDSNGTIVTKDFTDGKGTIYITQGSGGPPNGNSHLMTLDAERSAWFYEGFGFQDVYIRNSTHATIKFIETRNSSLLKTLEIVRRR